MTDALGGISMPPRTEDPDAQATVTDFLDYTEYLAAELVRSLTLIRNLDEAYIKDSSAIHKLTKTYGELPKLPAAQQREPQDLRSQISKHLSHAMTVRESSYAEASRLYDVTDRHFNRLTSILGKLKSLPKPPSRDPTPVPQPSLSPQTIRSRARKGDDEPTPRITLRFDGARTVITGRTEDGGSRHKRRNRGLTVPGEVMPPYNPEIDESSSGESDWESIPTTPNTDSVTQHRAASRRRGEKVGRIKIPKLEKTLKIKVPKGPRNRRPAGVMGTNVHSAVAGISTSNALALLKPPPENAILGSEDAPWLKLTAYEMAKLRKRMKKNAVWNPSDTMIRRELSDLGRGPENYHVAKARAMAEGVPLVDAFDIENQDNSGKRVLAEGEITMDSLGVEENVLSNRGMKLNEAKKLKKENMQKEAAALAAAEAEAAARKMAAAGSALQNIFRGTGGREVSESFLSPSKEKYKLVAKKRKREPTPELESRKTPGSEATPTATSSQPKKRKPNTPGPILAGTTTTTIPLAPPGPTSNTTASAVNPSQEKKASVPATARRRESVPPKAKTPETSVLPTRPHSRSTAPSTRTPTPGASSLRDRPRRSSTISFTATISEPAPSRTPARRSKRPAPGPVTATSDGGTAATVSKRTAAPKKKSAAAKKAEKAAKEETIEVDDEGVPIDPNEPRYCLCGDVSYGTMICCENGDCEIEWFHLECVNLKEIPGRTTKWYCPDCQRKLGIGEKGQPLLKGRKK